MTTQERNTHRAVGRVAEVYHDGRTLRGRVYRAHRALTAQHRDGVSYRAGDATGLSLVTREGAYRVRAITRLRAVGDDLLYVAGRWSKLKTEVWT